MDPKQQLIFNEIEFPGDPGVSDWGIVTISATLCVILLYATYRYFIKHKRVILCYLRYRILLLRALRKRESSREIAEKTYHLLRLYFNLPLLPDNSQLPPALQESAQQWSLFKHKLNAARFSNNIYSHQEMLELLQQCRQWLKP